MIPSSPRFSGMIREPASNQSRFILAEMRKKKKEILDPMYYHDAKKRLRIGRRDGKMKNPLQCFAGRIMSEDKESYMRKKNKQRQPPYQIRKHKLEICGYGKKRRKYYTPPVPSPSAEVRSSLSTDTCIRRASSSFLETTSGTASANLAHLEKQGFVIINIGCSAAVEDIPTLAFSRARTACAKTSR